MNQPEPAPGNPRKVTTMIFTEKEMELLDEALELAAREEGSEFFALRRRIKAAR